MVGQNKRRKGSDEAESTTTQNASSETTLDNISRISDLLLNLTKSVCDMRNTFNNSVSRPTAKTNIQQTLPVPPFDPSSKFSSINKFIGQLDQLSKIHNWDENTNIYGYVKSARIGQSLVQLPDRTSSFM